jgi:protease I
MEMECVTPPQGDAARQRPSFLVEKPMKAVILTADGFEDLELFYPWLRLREEHVEVILASPGAQPVRGEHGYVIEPDMPIRELNPAEYDLLILPGGAAVEKLRLREEAVDVVRTFMEDARRVVAIGRGAQLLISAGVLGGKRTTCTVGIRDDVRAAGGDYRDEAVVVDGQLVTVRGADDLPQLFERLTSLLGTRTRRV